MPWLVLMVLTAAPTEGRFVLEVSGLPLAELHVSVDGDQYVYQATHFLEEGPKEKRITFALSELPAPPEVLTLLTPGRPGCLDVVEERTRRVERLCVRHAAPAMTAGTIAGVPFTATYDVHGALAEITTGPSRWRAVSGKTPPPTNSPFTEGIAVPGDGPWVLDPPLSTARWVLGPVEGIGVEADVGRVRCLVLARRAVERQRHRRLAVGLMVEDGRAWPHAWVVEGRRVLDPSVLPGDPGLGARRYLEVPREGSGVFFLEFFAGTRTLTSRRR